MRFSTSPAPWRPAFLAGVLLLAPPASAAEVERISKDFSLEGLTGVHVESPVGAVRLIPQPRSKVSVEVILHCSGQFYPCRDRVRQVNLESGSSGDELRLRLGGPGAWWKTPKTWKLEVEIEVHYPEEAAVSVDLGEGDVELHGLAADACLEVGRGSVQVTVAQTRVGAVDLHVPKGRLWLRDAQGRQLGNPDNPFKEAHTVRWSEGEGPVRLEVRVGKGDALVQLR